MPVSQLYQSKEQFAEEYKSLYYGKTEAKEFYLGILKDLECAIRQGNLDNLINSASLIQYICDIENQAILREFYGDSNNPLRDTNVIIQACKYCKVRVLKYLLQNTDHNVLDNLSTRIGRSSILPGDTDESGHNAFYYAIRSGIPELLECLIKNWPHEYFSVHLHELDEVLSGAYEKIQLLNLPLSEEMKYFVEDKFVMLRFLGCPLGQRISTEAVHIKEIIDLLLENINLLNTEYENEKEVDGKFLFISKVIAFNIHLLKGELKSTYDRVPWEEIEFCVVAFIFSHTKKLPINLVYCSVLNKNKILKYLLAFSCHLEEIVCNMDSFDAGSCKRLPDLSREEVVLGIIDRYPHFKELYEDYYEIRDVCSLEKMGSYIDLAKQADCKETEGCLIIRRTLQVIGEHIKNTLESPKLSKSCSDLLLLAVPQNVREVCISLCNSLSQFDSPTKQIKIEGQNNVDFSDIQNDLKSVGNVIFNILYNIKIKVIRQFLTKVVSSKNVDAVYDIAAVLKNMEFDKSLLGSLNTKQKRLEKLFSRLNEIASDKTAYESELFKRMYSLINTEKSKISDAEDDFNLSVCVLHLLNMISGDVKINDTLLQDMKRIAERALKGETPGVEASNTKEIIDVTRELSVVLLERVLLKGSEDGEEVCRIMAELCYTVECGLENFNTVDHLREKLSEGVFSVTPCKAKVSVAQEGKHIRLFEHKILALKQILNKNALIDKLKLSSYKENCSLHVAVEVLVLDIMSHLASSNQNLEDDLVLKCLMTESGLRSYLAHCDVLFEVLSDPTLAVVLCARKLASENAIEKNKQNSYVVSRDMNKLRGRYNDILASFKVQKDLSMALEENNSDKLKTCIRNGADIFARNQGLWTTLHCAAKGSSLEIVKYLLEQHVDINMRDACGRSPLHVAAMFGRKNLVEFFLKEKGLLINDMDKNGFTALLLAVQNGHADVVSLLLNLGADIHIKNSRQWAAVHYAVYNNHRALVEVLCGEDVNAVENGLLGGHTLLHLAAENNHVELVEFFLEKKAKIDAQTYRGDTALHLAALNGHAEVVKVLLTNGADVDCRTTSGFVPMHYASSAGHEKVIDILLKFGADVNSFEKLTRLTSLHRAAAGGYEKIVRTLLENNASSDATTCEEMTSLHYAAQSGHLEVVKCLLEHKVDVNVQNVDLSTPLYFAAGNGHKDVVDLLLRNGALVNAETKDGCTPLHAAAREGDEGIVGILLKNRASVNKREKNQGFTALHFAAMSGNGNVIDSLIKNKAAVNAVGVDTITPLHITTQKGHENATAVLLENKADVNALNIFESTPLHGAAVMGHKNIVNLLIKYQANVNIQSLAGRTALHKAAQGGFKDVVEVLIAHGADVNAQDGNGWTPLMYAIHCRHKEIAQVLIMKGADVNAKTSEPEPLSEDDEIIKKICPVKPNERRLETPLHMAARKGCKETVEILVKRGAEVNAVDIDGDTPLYFAAEEGYEEIVDLLIAYGASVNLKTKKGLSPLHIAASSGCTDVLKILMENGAEVYAKDNRKQTPVELAVANNHLKTVEVLLHLKNFKVNTNESDSRTVLHIAAENGCKEIVKYLIHKGYSVNAKDACGSKPIHIAARTGNMDVLKYLLENGGSIGDQGLSGQSLLHYATVEGKLEVVKYLISVGADVNAVDCNGLTPLHIAASLGHKDAVEILLKNGANYNVVDNYSKTPLQVATEKNVLALLASTEKLFENVKRNRPAEVENCIERGAFVNASGTDGATALHFAAWKGFDEILGILLDNGGNPNSFDKKGFSPLHYAVKFSRMKAVKVLLFFGAVYNSVSVSGKTPLDLAEDKSIAELLKLVHNSFTYVERGNCKVVSDLNKLNDMETLRIVMRACNSERKTLVVVAEHSKFAKVKALKEIGQQKLSQSVDVAMELAGQNDFENAMEILSRILEIREYVLGPDNPGTLEIRFVIAKAVYKHGAFSEALAMLENILDKQKELLGIDHRDTLRTQSCIGLILNRRDKNEEALSVLEDAYEKQILVLGPRDPDTLETWFNIAMVLDRLQRHAEALTIFETHYKINKEAYGEEDHRTICSRNNVAHVLNNMGKHNEALKIFQEVFTQKTSKLGANHPDTLRTFNHIAGTLLKLKRHSEAVKAYQDGYKLQLNALGPAHYDTLHTLFNLASLQFDKGKWISAYKMYKKFFENGLPVFGPTYPALLEASGKMEAISRILKLTGEGSILDLLEENFHEAASNGKVSVVLDLLMNGADANESDAEGRTPLHFAVNNEHLKIVEILLEYGADARATDKGNTPLHTAVSKGFCEAVEMLMKKVKPTTDFINVQTSVGGMSALHIAAKNGSVDMVKLLLQHGAMYNTVNKDKKTPLQLSTDVEVMNLLKSIHDLFENVRRGKSNAINVVKSDQSVVLNARDKQGKTLLQVAIANKHKQIAKSLLEMLKSSSA